MDELKKGLAMVVEAALRAEAVGECERQMGGWGLALPAVAPVVLDFGLGDFYRVGLIEYWIANEQEAGYCGKYLFVFEGQQCPPHRHGKKHETFFVVKGMVELIVDGQSRLFKEGDVEAMPCGKVHSFTGLGNALLLELSRPCVIADNQFENPRITDWLRTFDV